MTEIENQTLRILRELRTELGDTKIELLKEVGETNTRLASIETRLEKVEKAVDRIRVRITIMETRQNDLTGDLAAIARVVEHAGLLNDGARR